VLLLLPLLSPLLLLALTRHRHRAVPLVLTLLVLLLLLGPQHDLPTEVFLTCYCFS
jgi:hypothetical protein